MTPRRRRILLALLATPLLAVLAFVVTFRALLFRPELDVVSIKTEAPYQDPKLLAEAWALPVAATYQKAGLLFQTNGSYCGPTSIANALSSTGEAPLTPDGVVANTGKCSLGICFGGLTLDELAEVTRQRTKRTVTVLRDLDLAAFRAELAKVNDPARRYVINFDRAPLFRRGGGHHSPIGGYLADRDLVFILDVNRTFQPWLVSSERLWKAMDTVDGTNHKKRGLLRIE